MCKNLNLKVEDPLFYEFHRLKTLLKADTNQDCLQKLLAIAADKITSLPTREERNQYLQQIVKNPVCGSSSSA